MLKLREDKFYILEIEGKKWVCETEEEAIENLKENVKQSNVDSDSIDILEVDISGEKWEIKGIPWSKIALQLIQES